MIILGLEIPQTLAGYQWSMVLFAFAGVAISYGKAKDADRKAYGLSTLITHFVPSGRRHMAAEASAFLLLGSLISLGVTDPGSIPQALAAGLAWTGLVTGK